MRKKKEYQPKEKEPDYKPKFKEADKDKTEDAFKRVWAARHQK